MPPYPKPRSGRVVLVVMLALGLTGCPNDAPVGEGPCLWHGTSYSPTITLPHELRMVALLDSRGALPPDVGRRLEEVMDALRSGDLDADGRAEFEPVGFDGVALTVPFDEPLWPVVEGELGSELGLDALVVLVTKDDLSGAERSDLLSRAIGHPPRFTFVALAGFPPDIVDERPWAFEELLGDPRMAWSSPAACTTEDGLEARPARELATLLDEHEAHDRAVSLCSPMWDRLLLEIGVRQSNWTVPLCLAGTPALGADQRLPCTYLERIPESSTRSCEDFAGRRRVDASTPRLCALQQLVPVDGAVPDEPGWYVDSFSEHHELLCGRATAVRVTDATEPISGGGLERLDCVERWGECGD